MLRSRPWLFAAAASALVALAFGCKDGPVPASQIRDIVPVTLDDDGFKPSRIPAQVGRPITLVVTRKVEKTCGTAIVIAQESIRRDLPLNVPVMVTFIPEKAGDVHFACPMNMLTGEIAVQDVEAVEEQKALGGKPKLKMKVPKGIPQPPAPPAMPAAPAMPQMPAVPPPAAAAPPAAPPH